MRVYGYYRQRRRDHGQPLPTHSPIHHDRVVCRVRKYMRYMQRPPSARKSWTSCTRGSARPASGTAAASRGWRDSTASPDSCAGMAINTIPFVYGHLLHASKHAQRTHDVNAPGACAPTQVHGHVLPRVLVQHGAARHPLPGATSERDVQPRAPFRPCLLANRGCVADVHIGCASGGLGWVACNGFECKYSGD